MTTSQSTAPVRWRDRQPHGLQEIKDQARRLRPQLAEHGLQLSNNQVLEMMARAHGFGSWGALKSQMQPKEGKVPEPSAPAKAPTSPDRISGLTASECFRRLKHHVDRFELPRLDVMADDLMTQMLLQGNPDGARHVERRAVVDIDKATLIDRLHRTRQSAIMSWRDRGQNALIAAIRQVIFTDQICCKPVLEAPASYHPPVVDKPSREHRLSANGLWKYAYKDLGSYFAGTDGHIAVISRSMKNGGLGDALTQELVDLAPQSADACYVSHDGSWASEGLRAAIEARIDESVPNSFDDYVDKTDFILTHASRSGMKATNKKLFLSIPWRPFDPRYYMLLNVASRLNIRVILRVTAADYTPSERAHLAIALEGCRMHVLAPKALLPQHPDQMPIYNDNGVPAYRVNPDWKP